MISIPTRADRLWSSPKLMTIASVLARAFATAAPLPFIYMAFEIETVVYWLLIITFQSLVGGFVGILPTVATQMIAYAKTGSTRVTGSTLDHLAGRQDAPNTQLYRQINRSTISLFRTISLVWILFASTIGTLIVSRAMMATPNTAESAAMWILFVLGSALRIAINPYMAYCLGLGEVAAIRRIEASSWLFAGVGVIIVLAVAPNPLLAMIALQAPVLLNLMRYKKLSRLLAWRVAAIAESLIVRKQLWMRAWRGSVAAFCAVFTIYGSGFILSQFGESSVTAGYLFGLNILGIATQVAISPLIAITPRMAGMFADGNSQGLVVLARQAIVQSKLIFVAIAISSPLAIYFLNAILSAPIEFPGPYLWIAMCVSTLLLRHAADHMYLFTVSNEIRGHIVNPLFLLASLGPFIWIEQPSVWLLVGLQGTAAICINLPYSRMLTMGNFGYPLAHDIRDLLLPFGTMVGILTVLAAFRSQIILFFHRFGEIAGQSFQFWS